MAEEPVDGAILIGDGTLALQGGLRTIPQHTFIQGMRNSGLNPQYSPLTPYGVFSGGYQLDEQLHVSVDFAYGIETTGLTGGDAQNKNFGLLFCLDGAFFQRRWITLYGGGGIGYSINTFSRAGSDTESNSSAGLVKLGARIALNKKLALVIEDRYIFSSAYWPAAQATMNTGGNVFTVGLMLHFFSGKEEHPMR
ncbi:MAG: outer membrane beta-barrel protein [Deltaproteobacteria bacterium]|nr:outer membrane beta-barrel protein [Deltaproteobacteria bacterium]